MANNFRYFRGDANTGHQRLNDFVGFEISYDNNLTWRLLEDSASVLPQESFDEQSLWSMGTATVSAPY